VYKVQGNGTCKGDARDLNLIQEDGKCFNSVGNANSPAGGEWFFLEVSRHINPSNFYTAQRVTGMTGGAAGKVWQRSQQSGTSGAGWSSWVQQGDPGVSTANSSLTASGSVNAGTNMSVGANSYILGQGGQGNYGATTLAGQKNGWTGLEFRDSSGNYQVNLMTNRNNIGYYDAAGGRWLNSTDMAGNLTLDQTVDFASGRLNPGWAVETWACSTGQIAKAAFTLADGLAYNGIPLYCNSGAWKSGAKLPQNSCYWSGLLYESAGPFICAKSYYLAGFQITAGTPGRSDWDGGYAYCCSS
jgi:hypothetical protein